MYKRIEKSRNEFQLFIETIRNEFEKSNTVATGGDHDSDQIDGGDDDNSSGGADSGGDASKYSYNMADVV